MIIICRNIHFKQAVMFMLYGLLPCFGMAQLRNKSEAEKVAYNFVKNKSQLLNDKDLKLSITSSLLSSNEKLCSDKEAYYIFSNDENGFIIVSGDERMPAILAYSENSTFDCDSIPPNVKYWLDCYVQSFFALNNYNSSSWDSFTSVGTDEVAPLLENNTWGQDSPYNLLCPSVRNEKCVTGCVATAMAQVMNYYKYPITGRGQINYRTSTNGIQIQHDLSSVYFNWEDIKDDYSIEYSSVQANAVANLMYACGTAVHMDYCTNSQGGSGAFQFDLIPAYVDNFNYDRDAAFIIRDYCTDQDWHRILINELNEGRPINYAGQSISDGGHSFVFDGYKINNDNKYPYYHVNWGWGGKFNGYYQVADLHPVDNGLYATSNGFDISQQITIGIKPEDGEDNGVFYLCTPNLYTSTTSTKPGTNIQVYSAWLGNFSYKNFDGSIHVALISQEDGSEFILGESNIKTLGYMQDQSNISVSITLPSDLNSGNYTIRFYSRQNETEKYNQVFSTSYPEITISTRNDDTTDVSNETMLGCTELELINTEDPSEISLNLYEIQNFLETPFIGDLRMILADSYGKPLSIFGDSLLVGELSMYEIQEHPLKLKGKLTGNWNNGNYRLYVGARPINTSDYIYLYYYDITQPFTTSQELFLNAQIQDGTLSISGHAFEILPTHIKSITIKEIEDTSVYNLNGIYLGNYESIYSSLKNGMYIIRTGNTIRKVLIIND